MIQTEQQGPAAAEETPGAAANAAPNPGASDSSLDEAAAREQQAPEHMATIDQEVGDATVNDGAAVAPPEAADALRAELERLRAEHKQELQAVKAELEAAQDQLMRRAAEFQNYRRRTEQERSQLFEMGKTAAVQGMLDVLDDFERSLTAATELADKKKTDAKAYKALKEGVDLVHRKFVDALKQLGVEPIEAEGQPFDEHQHEAMMQQPAPDDVPSGTVLGELQRGYRLGERVIRHSKVIVAM